jgi:hypothetical protein
MKQRRTTKNVLTVFCDSGHETTLMLSVLSNCVLKDENVKLWCPVCNKTGILQIDTARIITNYE